MASLGLRATARELDISHPGLLKAVRTGRVPPAIDGKYDVEACRAALTQNTQPLKSGYARLQKSEGAPEPEPSEAAAVVREADRIGEEQRSFDTPPLPDSDSVAEATRQLEWQRVREKKLKVDRDEGKVVEVAAINAYVAGMILQARDELIRMATEMRDELAHELDPLKCEELLLTSINSILRKMSEYRRES